MAAAASSGPLSGADLDTWTSLATVMEWLPPALDAPLRAFEMTHFEYGILYALAHAPDRTLRMSVLAESANSSLTRLSRAVTRLETRRWTTREPDPRDGRFTLATLTDEGMRSYVLATPVHEENVRRLVLNVLTQAQKQQIREIASRVTGVIRTGSGRSRGR